MRRVVAGGRRGRRGRPSGGGTGGGGLAVPGMTEEAAIAVEQLGGLATVHNRDAGVGVVVRERVWRGQELKRRRKCYVRGIFCF